MHRFALPQTKKTVSQSDKGLAQIAEGASPRRHLEYSPVRVKDHDSWIISCPRQRFCVESGGHVNTSVGDGEMASLICRLGGISGPHIIVNTRGIGSTHSQWSGGWWGNIVYCLLGLCFSKFEWDSSTFCHQYCHKIDFSDLYFTHKLIHLCYFPFGHLQ